MKTLGPGLQGHRTTTDRAPDGPRLVDLNMKLIATLTALCSLASGCCWLAAVGSPASGASCYCKSYRESGDLEVYDAYEASALEHVAVAIEASVPPGERVAIPEFRGTASGEHLAVRLESRLAQGGHATVVSRSRLQEVLGELQLTRDDLFDAEKRQQLGRFDVASTLVLGTASHGVLTVQLSDVTTATITDSTEICWAGERGSVESIVERKERDAKWSISRQYVPINSTVASPNGQIEIRVARIKGGDRPYAMLRARIGKRRATSQRLAPGAEQRFDHHGRAFILKVYEVDRERRVEIAFRPVTKTQ